MNRLIRARVLVVATFLFVTLVQGYSLFTLRGGPSPDYAVYVPNPYFLMAFFAMQTGLQFYWILQLFQRGVREPRSAPLLDNELGGVEMQTETNFSSSGEPAQMAYVPLYSLANVFLVGSTIAWQFSQFSASQICMTFNAACHLYFIFFALNTTGRHAWTPKNRLTHLIAKTSAGVALLYMWRAWGVMEIGRPFRPAIQQQAHCGVLVLLLAFASGPDPTLGICLLFDLAALAAGDTTKDEWKFAFSCIMGVLSVVIVSDCILSRRASQNVVSTSHSRDNSEDEESALHQDGSEEIFLADLTTEGSHRV